MSEPTEQDELEEPTVTDVPEPDQPSDDETSEEEAAEAEQGAEEPAEASVPPVDAAKEQRRMAAALKREKDAHDRKLEKILGPAHEHVLACPLCGDGMQGYVFPGDGPMMSDEQRDAVLAFVGGIAERHLKSAQGVVECENCDGWGQLAFPGKVPHVQEQMCPKCSGSGYVLDVQQQSNVAPINTATTATWTGPMGEVAPCSVCGAPNSQDKPHFCNPVVAAVT